MIPAYRKHQINLQHRFYIKGSNTNDRVQKHNGRLKNEFEIQYDNHGDDTRRAPHPAHRCDANLPDLHREDGAHSTVHPGGSGCPIQDAQTSSKSAGTQPAKKGTTTTLSILILSKAYPTLGILSPLPRHAKLFGSGVLLLKGC